jgi:hypothetical protein
MRMTKENDFENDSEFEDNDEEMETDYTDEELAEWEEEHKDD